MIGSLISAGVGLIGGLFGASKAAREKRRQQEMINTEAARNEAWYNNNYYRNYMDSTEARAAMKRVQDTLDRRSRDAQANAEISGATPEAVLAQQENDQQILAQTAENLAARADANRQRVDTINQANRQNIMNQRIQQSQATESGASTVMNNSLGLIGSALSLLDGKKKDNNLLGTEG